MGDRLKGKVAIITGAGTVGQGIGNGKATAIVFAREGARVMLVDINPEAVQETKSLIDKEGGTSMTFTADVMKASDCQNMIKACVDTFGRVDILDNNVGLGQAGGVLDLTEETWDRVMAVNVRSMFFTCKYVIPHMLRQGGGSIINIASLQAIRTTVPAAVYAASKGAVLALTREIAIEFAARGIRANCILPGVMKTPRISLYYTKAYGGDVDLMWQRRDAMSPTGKQGESWDVAYAALFLASDESKYVNGMNLLVDGGLADTTRIFAKQDN
jgi:NAD(P)-dependent dehydrogenase (short-subunit alcohol dehydrogenase family)